MMLQEGKDGVNFAVGIHGIVNPMDVYASLLHSSEPCHLPFGKLTDSNTQAFYHFIITHLANDVKGDESVFQTIINEVISRYSAFQQTADLFHQTFL